MSTKLKNKTVSLIVAVTTVIWLSGFGALVPVAGAQTSSTIQQLLDQIAQLQAQLLVLQGGSSTSTSCSFSRSLTVGSTGDDVKCLQQYLNSSGFQVASSGFGSPGN